MSERENSLLLEDILEAAIKIKRYCNGYTFVDFLDDEKTMDAVVRNFEIIGEASNRIEREFKLNHLEVEWIALSGFRNRLIHEYFGIDYEIVWDIIQYELDPLIIILSELQ